MKRAFITLLVALSLLVPWPAVLQAAVAHVQTIEFNDGAASATTLVSGSITTTAGNLLLVLVNVNTQLTSAVAESGGGTFTKADEVQNGIGNSASLWYRANAAGGSHTYTITFGASSGFDSGFLMEVSGAATSAPLDGTCAKATDGGSNEASAATGNFTTVGTSFIAAVDTCGNCVSSTPGSGWTEPTNGESGTQMGSVEYKANPGTTTQNGTFTFNTNSRWAAVGCGFKVAGAAGTAPCLRSLLGVGSC